MKISNSTSIVFNVAGAVIGVAALAGAVRYTLFKPQIPPCEARYKHVMRLPLEQDGKLISTDDLQARVGGRDKGLSNVEIGREPDAPKAAALKVSLPAGSLGPEAASNSGGMHFPWEPRAIAQQTAACLAYDVKLSADFELTENGLLPGITGADPQEDERFEVYLSWDRSGEGTVRHKIATKEPAQSAKSTGILTNPVDLSNNDTGYGVELAGFELPKGKWLRINQELVLNKPDQSDGVLRLFIDGKLIFERSDMHLRTLAETTLRGAALAAHVLGADARYQAAKDGSVSFSPFELYW